MSQENAGEEPPGPQVRSEGRAAWLYGLSTTTSTLAVISVVDGNHTSAGQRIVRYTQIANYGIQELRVTSEAEDLEPLRIRPNELLSEIKWHLLRYDSLRLSLASRGALVLSANALVATGATVLAGQRNVTSNADNGLAMAAGTILTLILVGSSVSYSTSAIMNIRPWRKSYGNQIPIAIVYDASDTIREMASFNEFSDMLHKMTDTDALGYAISNLWRSVVSYRARYTRLRTAVKLLFAGLCLFLITVAIQLAFTSNLLS